MLIASVSPTRRSRTSRRSIRVPTARRERRAASVTNRVTRISIPACGQGRVTVALPQFLDRGLLPLRVAVDETARHQHGCTIRVRMAAGYRICVALALVVGV